MLTTQGFPPHQEYLVVATCFALEKLDVPLNYHLSTLRNPLKACLKHVRT